jgi:hypothetical protein
MTAWFADVWAFLAKIQTKRWNYFMFSDSEMEEEEWKPLSEEQSNSFYYVFCWCKGVRFEKVKETEKEDW